MCVYICVYVCIYVRVYMCICVHICVCVCVYRCVYVFRCMYVYMCVYTCVYMCMCVYMCIYMCICVCICMCVYICVYVYIYVCVCIYMCMYAVPPCLVVSVSLRLPPLDCSPPGSSVLGVFRQEYWSGLPFLSPGNLPNPGIEPASTVFPALQADSLPTKPSGKPNVCVCQCMSVII